MQPQEEQLNHSGNPFSQWVEHVTKQLIDDDAAALLSPIATDQNDAAMGMLTALFECAVAISLDNLGEAHRMLLELSQTASPYGPSPAERVVAHFAKAMSSRVVNSWIGVCTPIPVDFRGVHAAFHVYNTTSPFVKFAHFTSNQAILEACSGHRRLHIIDVDIMQGLQWPALFHILATRAEGPPHVRMTGMGASGELLLETEKQLSSFARRLGMQFEFHAVEGRFGDVADVSALHVRRGEAVAVHWLQHSLYDATGPDWKTMRLLQGVGPRVVTLVEQEMSHGGSFLDRFVASLHYYATMFDSVGESGEGERHGVEQGVLQREINNVVAVGGPTRSGEEKWMRWRREMAGKGFVQMGMSGNAMAQAQLILNMFPRGYSLVQGDHGTLSLGWKDTSLYTASAWTWPNHHHHF
ncbi:protein SCARECROW-like [Salvia hispanica]|uniref:protein SCARECROW-like n=1 Tax=Salvia hispanica TaxID=49212 RepID=UPI0020093DBF|nr:protein SCARECROW-like [Salvia hispanica]